MRPCSSRSRPSSPSASPPRHSPCRIPGRPCVAGLELFLDVCREPEVRQIALLDAPSVLGWTTWREIESRYSLGLIQAGLQNLIDAGIAEPQPIDPLAHAMLGMLTEAGLYVAGADDADAARDEMAACSAGRWRAFERADRRR